MSKYPAPVPIFDTLETLENTRLQVTNKSSFALRDFKAALNFLIQYNGNKATFESYRREVERLIQWAWHIAEKSILTLKRQDIEAYLAFCLKPPKSWIGFKRVPRFITQNGQRVPNSQWRPFVVSVSKYDFKRGIKPDKEHYHLSQKALQEVFTVLRSFYNYLVLEERVSINPVALIRQKSKYLQKNQSQASIKRLTDQQWEVCIETAKEMAISDPYHERTLFIITALYLLYLRISELAASSRWVPQMSHFYQDSQSNWWFKTVGKGNKLRTIAVSDDMLVALQKYRESMQLPALPYPDDKTPLIPKEKGRGAITSTRHIRRVVQLCFNKTIDKLREKDFSVEADMLEVATVHWLRHTGISDDINKRMRPVSHVRDDAGHSSSVTTDKYNDIELTQRNETAKNKKLKPDSNRLENKG